MKYYPNNGRECANTALSNLILELGDYQSADLVYNSFHQHKLVSGNGGLPGCLIPRLAREITGGKYSGIAYESLGFVGLESQFEELYGDRWESLFEAILEEKDEGNIKVLFDWREIPKPHILGIHPKVLLEEVNGRILKIPYYGDSGHAIVLRKTGTFIDNGYVVDYDVKDLRICATIEIQRNA